MLLTQAQLRRLLARQRGWLRQGDALVRDLRFRDFDEAMTVAQRIGERAVDYQRRPDMYIEAGRLRLSIPNRHHAGITLAEIRLAAKVNDVLEAQREPARV